MELPKIPSAYFNPSAPVGNPQNAAPARPTRPAPALPTSPAPTPRAKADTPHDTGVAKPPSNANFRKLETARPAKIFSKPKRGEPHRLNEATGLPGEWIAREGVVFQVELIELETANEIPSDQMNAIANPEQAEIEKDNEKPTAETSVSQFNSVQNASNEHPLVQARKNAPGPKPQSPIRAKGIHPRAQALKKAPGPKPQSPIRPSLAQSLPAAAKKV